MRQALRHIATLIAAIALTPIPKQLASFSQTIATWAGRTATDRRHDTCRHQDLIDLLKKS